MAIIELNLTNEAIRQLAEQIAIFLKSETRQAPQEPEAHQEPEAPKQPELTMEQVAEALDAEQVAVATPPKKEEPITNEITVPMLRAEMDGTFERILGVDWKEKMQTDGRVRQLKDEITRCLKSIARNFGADKPTEVAVEKRKDFLNTMHTMQLSPLGKIDVFPF